MTSTVHTTRAYVLSSRNTGDANRALTLLTRELGTVVATAQSVRRERSRLRFALQRFSFAEVSLVRGRGGWRVTNAYPLENIFFSATPEKRCVIVNASKLLRRLLQGEFPDADLYDIVSSGFFALLDVRQSDVQIFELMFVSKLLSNLGYDTHEGTLKPFKLGSFDNEALKERAVKERVKIVREINTALASSGL